MKSFENFSSFIFFEICSWRFVLRKFGQEIYPLNICSWRFFLLKIYLGDFSLFEDFLGDISFHEDVFMEICPLKIFLL